MFRNFFLSAHRNIVRNKVVSAIQVSSLAVGFTAFILIVLYAGFEMRYDRFNEKFDRIYRLEYGNRVGMPTAIGHRIKTRISEVENVVRLVNWHGKDNEIPVEIKNRNGEQETFFIEDWFYCDSSIFEVFTFEFIQGNPSTLLREPNTCVISESTAQLVFGDEDPVGKFISDWKVEGLFRNLHNAHLEINVLYSITSFENDGNKIGSPDYLDNYYPDLSYMTYVLLREGRDPDRVSSKINDILNINTQEENAFLNEDNEFNLRPLGEVYFADDAIGEKNYCRHGNLKMLIVLITTSLFTLVLAVINYVNLTTARASLRAREVAIRKAMGSSRTTLIVQFLVEAVLVALFSIGIALTLIQLLLPGFNRLMDTNVGLNLLENPFSMLLFILLGIILGIISGLYPSIYLTRFRVVTSLSGKTRSVSGQVLFRRTLLTFQFMVSVILIVGVIVILKQLHFMKSANLGFDKDLVVNFIAPQIGNDHELRKRIRNRLSAHPDILNVGFSNHLQGNETYFAPWKIEVNGISTPMAVVAIDPDFFDVMGIGIIEGRNYSWDRETEFWPNTDNYYRILFNETAVREFELEEPVGYTQKLRDGIGEIEIIGVVDDFNFTSQHKKIEPTFYAWFNYLGLASVKISPNNIPKTLQYISNVMEELIPESVLRYSFLDETFDRQYRRDEKTAIIISFFALIAVIIACLGLYGLSSFMAARRTKEIGIRKSLGATERSVFLLLSKEFSKWVFLAIVLSVPLSWMIMHRWLQSFAYRTDISWWIFLLAILISFLITLITVTGHSLKIARTNPAQSLRYE